MDFVHSSTNLGIAEAKLKRGKVNALNEQGVEEIHGCFQGLAADPDIGAGLPLLGWVFSSLLWSF